MTDQHGAAQMYRANYEQKKSCLHILCVWQEPRQKIIDIETCIQMLSIVMTNQAHLQPFTDFLQHQTEYKFITNDQWMGFYRFSLEVMPCSHDACLAVATSHRCMPFIVCCSHPHIICCSIYWSACVF